MSFFAQNPPAASHHTQRKSQNFTVAKSALHRGPSRWQRSKTWGSPSSPQIHQKYIYKWNNSYRTPTEHWQKTSDFPKGKKIPTYLGGAKEKRKIQRQKNRDRTCTSGRELWRRKRFHTLGSPCTGGDGGWAGGKLQSDWGECSNRGAEGKAERFPHRGSVATSTHQPERLVCSTTRAGQGWELRLELWRSDPRERTGVGCVNTAWRGLVHHS